MSKLIQVQNLNLRTLLIVSLKVKV